MLARYLPLILIAPAALALAPVAAAAQVMMGPGIRTEMTPADREAHNGVFDHKPKSLAAGLKPTVDVGEVQPVEELKAEDVAARYVTRAVPYSTDPPPSADPEAGPKAADKSSENRAHAPRSEGSQVRPAQAAAPERATRSAIDPKDDPRGVEERKDPGD